MASMANSMATLPRSSFEKRPILNHRLVRPRLGLVVDMVRLRLFISRAYVKEVDDW
jgi:hypothetical protein